MTRAFFTVVATLAIVGPVRAQSPEWQPERTTPGWVFTPAVVLGGQWDSNVTVQSKGNPHFSEWAGVLNGLTASELGVTYLLPRAIGTSNASWMLLTGTKVGAAEAQRLGLVTQVVPDATLVDEALAMAERLCELSPFGIHMTKQTMWANLEATSLTAAIELENRNQLLAGYTGNLEEAKAAFREKRKPTYRD